MKRIEVYDEDRVVAIELEENVETISEILDDLIVPALQGLTFREETIARGMRDYADSILGIEESDEEEYPHRIKQPVRVPFDY